MSWFVNMYQSARCPKKPRLWQFSQSARFPSDQNGLELHARSYGSIVAGLESSKYNARSPGS